MATRFAVQVQEADEMTGDLYWSNVAIYGTQVEASKRAANLMCLTSQSVQVVRLAV